MLATLGTRLAVALLIVAVSSAAVAAPGRSGDSRATDYRAAANDACARFDRKTNALPQITTAAELKRQILLVPKLFTAMVGEIAALRSPAGKAAASRRLVAALREIQRRLGEVRDASLRGDQAGANAAVQAGKAPSARAAAAAKALGLSVCARLASTFAKGSMP